MERNIAHYGRALPREMEEDVFRFLMRRGIPGEGLGRGIPVEGLGRGIPGEGRGRGIPGFEDERYPESLTMEDVEWVNTELGRIRERFLEENSHLQRGICQLEDVHTDEYGRFRAVSRRLQRRMERVMYAHHLGPAGLQLSIAEMQGEFRNLERKVNEVILRENPGLRHVADSVESVFEICNRRQGEVNEAEIDNRRRGRE